MGAQLVNGSRNTITGFGCFVATSVRSSQQSQSTCMAKTETCTAHKIDPISVLSYRSSWSSRRVLQCSPDSERSSSVTVPPSNWLENTVIAPRSYTLNWLISLNRHGPRAPCIPMAKESPSWDLGSFLRVLQKVGSFPLSFLGVTSQRDEMSCCGNHVPNRRSQSRL